MKTFPEVIPAGGGPQAYQQWLRGHQEAIVNRWRPLLEGNEDKGLKPLDRKVWPWMAMLFENQYTLAPDGRVEDLLETTALTDVSLPQRFALPIVRKVYPQLIVSEIASIQPMPAVSGGAAKIFYMTHKEATAGTTLHDNLDSDRALGSESSVPLKIKAAITSETVTARKHILGAEWTSEVAEDLRFSLGIDIEQELINVMANEILRELDYEFLNVILNGATAGDTEWDETVPSGTDTVAHWQTLYGALVDASNDIFANRYKDGEYIVAGTTLAGYIAKMRGYEGVKGDVVQNRGSVAVVRMGTLMERWTVYKTTMIGAARGIMGIYPTSQLDGNFVYAPYIPVQAMPLVYAAYNETTGAYQNKDSWTRNVRSRGAFKLVNPDAFSTLTVTTS